ncbi:hypothetical protein LZC95_08445 [Pendulispora brunnea]|uniref:Secreted protein n=1 Tax=Pendulispora brunnea TaxID=2905690 RepID=A0ABZ2KIU0_9BACT
MRQTYLWITLCLGVGTAACGGSSKPATDPSSGSSASTSSASSEPAPKWDDSSESADNARHPQFSSSPAPAPAAADGSRPAPAPAAAPAGGTSQRRTDSYDKEATEVVLKRAARQVKDNCGSAKDENGKASGPWGKTMVTVNLGHNGRSKGATVGAPFDGKPTGRCATQAFANLVYPPWAGGDTTVQWEVDIAAPKDAK